MTDINKLWEELENNQENKQEKITNKIKNDLAEDLELADYDKLVNQVNFKVSTGLKRNYNNSKETLSNGYTKISINRKWLDQEKSQPEIAITIKKNGDINIRINPYDHYDEYYFIAENLDLFDICKEIDNISLEYEIWSENSKLKKIEYPKEDEFDPNDWLTDEQLEGFNQEEYDRILKEEGEEAAVKYADVNKDKKNS